MDTFSYEKWNQDEVLFLPNIQYRECYCYCKPYHFQLQNLNNPIVDDSTTKYLTTLSLHIVVWAKMALKISDCLQMPPPSSGPTR